MKKLQEKLDFLVAKYNVGVKPVLKNKNAVIIDGKEIPVFPYRNERRFVELKNIVHNGTLVEVSVMRVSRITEAGKDVYEELYREFGICQYVLQRKIKSVMVMENGNVLNAIATTEDGIVCTLEISATLKNGEIEKDKHEIISQRGIACDVVVDAQLKQDSIYVFGNENKKYTDVDFELYGLSAEEVSIVRVAFSVAKNKNYDEMVKNAAELCKLTELAKKSAKSGEREVMQL